MVDVGRLELGKLEPGNVELGNVEVGKLELSKVDDCKLELGEFEVGKGDVAKLVVGKLTLGKLVDGTLCEVDVFEDELFEDEPAASRLVFAASALGRLDFDKLFAGGSVLDRLSEPVVEEGAGSSDDSSDGTLGTNGCGFVAAAPVVDGALAAEVGAAFWAMRVGLIDSLASLALSRLGSGLRGTYGTSGTWLTTTSGGAGSATAVSFTPPAIGVRTAAEPAEDDSAEALFERSGELPLGEVWGRGELA